MQASDELSTDSASPEVSEDCENVVGSGDSGAMIPA